MVPRIGLSPGLGLGWHPLLRRHGVPLGVHVHLQLDMWLRDLALAAKRGEKERFTGAPYHAPRRRLDETRAARQPILKWTPPQPVAEAAE